jgi:hypothetical protein
LIRGRIFIPYVRVSNPPAAQQTNASNNEALRAASPAAFFLLINNPPNTLRSLLRLPLIARHAGPCRRVSVRGNRLGIVQPPPRHVAPARAARFPLGIIDQNAAHRPPVPRLARNSAANLGSAGIERPGLPGPRRRLDLTEIFLNFL